MSVFKTSWRCSLAATALWAVLGPNSGLAVGQGTAPGPAPSDKPPVKAVIQPDGSLTLTATVTGTQDVPAQRQKLMEQLRELRQKMKDLKPDQDKERQDLQARIGKLYEQLKSLRWHAPATSAPRMSRPSDGSSSANSTSCTRKRKAWDRTRTRSARSCRPRSASSTSNSKPCPERAPAPRTAASPRRSNRSLWPSSASCKRR